VAQGQLSMREDSSAAIGRSKEVTGVSSTDASPNSPTLLWNRLPHFLGPWVKGFNEEFRPLLRHRVEPGACPL